jgi:DNA-binding response OmpR family regulator
MDGLETARELKKLRPGTPAILMPGFSGDALTNRGFELDRMTVIDKPFAPSTLLRAIRERLNDSEAICAESLAGAGPARPPSVDSPRAAESPRFADGPGAADLSSRDGSFQHDCKWPTLFHVEHLRPIPAPKASISKGKVLATPCNQ